MVLQVHDTQVVQVGDWGGDGEFPDEICNLWFANQTPANNVDIRTSISFTRGNNEATVLDKCFISFYDTIDINLRTFLYEYQLNNNPYIFVQISISVSHKYFCSLDYTRTYT